MMAMHKDAYIHAQAAQLRKLAGQYASALQHLKRSGVAGVMQVQRFNFANNLQ